MINHLKQSINSNFNVSIHVWKEQGRLLINVKHKCINAPPVRVYQAILLKLKTFNRNCS